MNPNTREQAEGTHRSRTAPVAAPALPTRTKHEGARLYELDALRLAAALSVMIYHYTFSGPGGGLISLSFPGISQVTRYGYLGVDAFFMISGFVVLLSAWDRTPRRFLVSRAVRLYPAYWAAVTLTAIVCAVLGAGRFPVSGTRYLANLTMLNAPLGVKNVDVVYWTLWSELRFYIVVFALVLIGLTRRRVTAVLWGWLGTAVLIETGLLPPTVSRALEVLVQSQWAHYFIAGMALCLLRKYGPSRSAIALVLAAFGNALYRGIGFAEAVGRRYGDAFSPTVVSAVITAIFLIMVGVALGWTHRLGRSWFVEIGALTYPLYLLHAYIGFILFNQLQGTAEPHILLAAVCIIMIASAYAVHRWIEKPIAWALNRVLARAADPVSTTTG
ncbi:acyltransferase [Streptomyces spinoverrucosus]|uniref:Acyltransferase n=1 Tax=Streptomyces spinoverrucosus TaxID=284043 RepID=A0A4Y3VZ84_9ACTN|nr:acyltransferase [Streptomyces spinoverrucosus]GEC10356.1 acyltransferase [Streptomyces spinoverrucosus]GHB98524.1 acyltransferase [Streptomyces spinoverrucosus]